MIPLLMAALLVLMFAGSVTANSAKHRRVTLVAPGVHNKVRPRKIYTSYASLCSATAKHLAHWRHWGSDRTSARGLLHYSTGNPDCASGSRQVHGLVGLSHIHRCGNGLHYRRAHFSYFGHHRYDVRVDFNCRGIPVGYHSG